MGNLIKPRFPPNTSRYCIACECKRNFKYNQIIGHSECCVCFGRFSADTESPVIQSFLKRINNLKEEVKRLSLIDLSGAQQWNKEKTELITRITNQRANITQLEKQISELKQKPTSAIEVK